MKTEEALSSAQDLMAWFEERDAQIMAASTDLPACWGGQYRVDERGSYVDEATFDGILPGDLDRDLWLAIANIGPAGAGGLTATEIIAAAKDGSIGRLASDACTTPESPCFYTEIIPGDLTDEELADLAAERPELFDGESIGSFPELVAALEAPRPAVDLGRDAEEASLIARGGLDGAAGGQIR